MSQMFRQAAAFNQNIGGWNVRSVTNFSGMFSSALTFNNASQPMPWSSGGGIGNGVVGNIINMSNMFLGATSFDVDITTWPTTKVNNFAGMFQGSAFNRDISVWDVSNVIGMNNMFNGNVVFNQPIKYWNVGSSTFNGMFGGATQFNNTYLGTTGYVTTGTPPGTGSAG